MRLLPLTIAISLALFAVKLGDIYTYGYQQSTQGFILDSYAEEEASADEEASSEEKEEIVESEEGQENSEANPEQSDGAAQATPPEPPAEDPSLKFTKTEVDLLQSLSKRREELDEWAKKLELHENLLHATEMKLDRRITELKDLKTEVETLLAEYNKHEEEKIRSLVKIYENMKPKDAARIFEEIDMEVLLRVADKMQEKKLALVLAKMNPLRAKELTMELAEQKRLPSKLDGNG